MLAKLEGYAAALLESLDATELATVVREFNSLEQTVLSRSDLRAVLSDTSIAGVARGLVLRDLLEGKVHPTTLRLAVFAATNVPAQEVDHAIAELSVVARVLESSGSFHQTSLGLLEARRRVGGFADALLDQVDTSNFDDIEDGLFRWARTVEANIELRRLLLDRDAPLESRLGTVRQLLAGKVDDVTLRLCCYVIEGGRPRDVVGTLDFLVDYVARARDWRVARVHTARPLDRASQTQLVGSLTTLTGKNVELQIAEEPSLLGGVLVEVGDLRLDATTRGRLGVLHDAVSSGRLYESAFESND
ncbi:MAG: F0F1 ATP synthase subunit delta [Acidimicrobiales bacterium]